MVQSEIPGIESEQPEKKGFSLFKKKQEPAGATVSDILKQVIALDRRLRVLEGRNTDLNRRIQMTDKNMLNERKIVIREIKTIDSDMLEVKRQVNELKDQVTLIINELKTCARKEDLDALGKYIELWEPVNFVTKKEVDKIIEEKLEDKKGKK